MQSATKRIHLMLLLFFSLLTLLIYGGIYRPIAQRLEHEMEQNFNLIAKNKQLIAHEYLMSLRSATEALSSRSMIRDALYSYQGGEITFAALQTFTEEKYADGAAVIENPRGIGRFLPSGKTVTSIGEEAHLSTYLTPGSDQLLLWLDIDAEAVIVQSPILMGDNVLGYDLLVMDLQSLLQEIEGPDYEVVLTNERIEGTVEEAGTLTSYHTCETAEASIGIRAQSKQIYGPVSAMTRRISIGYLLVLLLIYLFIYRYVVGYMNRLLATQASLKRSAQARELENALLIEEMNKGFVQLKVQMQADGQVSGYIIADVNRTFADMTGRSIDSLRGRLLSEVFFANWSTCAAVMNDVIKTGTSRQFEHVLSGEQLIWLISLYRPQEGRLAMICEDITAKKRLESQLIEREKQLRLILQVTGEGTWDWHFNERLVHHNKRWYEILGFDEEHRSHPMEDFFKSVHPEDRSMVKRTLEEARVRGGEFVIEYRMIREDGQEIWVRDRGACVAPNGTDADRMVGSIADITARKKAEKALFREKETLRSTLLSVGDGIITTDTSGLISMMNPTAERLTGWPQEEALGRPLTEIFQLIHAQTKEPFDRLEAFILEKQLVKDYHKQAMLVTRSGEERSVVDNLAPVHDTDDQVIGFVLVFRDVTDEVEKQQKIEYLSMHDELTGLYNRRYMEDTVQRLDTARNLPFTIMVLDLNALKLANDVFGHQMGDRLIQKAAHVLREVMRSDDLIMRTGGDEFAILLPQTNAEEAERIKERIQKTASTHHVDPLSVSIAIGYAVKTSMHRPIDETMRSADEDMYRDKLSMSRDFKEELIAGFLETNRSHFEAERVHNEEVASYGAALYKALGKSDDEVHEFRDALLLHDIGKITLPPELLNKPVKLTEEEHRLIRQHAQASYQILRSLSKHAVHAEAILHHHERYDGSGYPDGLSGESIPLEARVIAVVDAYQAMTSQRPYSPAMPQEEAIAVLRSESGKQFDPYLVNLFIDRVLGHTD